MISTEGIITLIASIILFFALFVARNKEKIYVLPIRSRRNLGLPNLYPRHKYNNRADILMFNNNDPIYEELIPQVNARVFRKVGTREIVIIPQEICQMIINEYLKINNRP